MNIDKQTQFARESVRLRRSKGKKTVTLVKLFILLATFMGVQERLYAACSPQLNLTYSTYTFVNNTSSTAKLSWVDGFCFEYTEAILSPGASINFFWGNNNIWRFRNATTNTLLSETAATTANLTVPALIPTVSLSLTGPATAATGKAFPLTATLTNTSTAAATAGAISVKATLPAGLAYSSGSSTSGAFSCSAVGQNVTCNRSTAMAAAATDTLTVNATASTTGAKAVSFNVSGGGIASAVASNSVTTNVVTPSDLSLSIGQPNPTFREQALSQIEVTLNNIGTSASTAPTTLTFNFPATVSVPPSFNRAADSWRCTTSGQVVTCTYNLSLPAGNNTRLRIPVTPNVGTAGTSIGAFTASVAQDVLENNVANNGPVSMTPAVAVARLVIPALPSTNPISLLYGSFDIMDPAFIPKYVMPLPNLFDSSYKHKPDNSVAGLSKYTLDIRETRAHILPPGFPRTTVFAYGDPARPGSFNYPGPTIEARSTNSAVNASLLGKQTQVQYQTSFKALNGLTETGHLLNFIAPDATLNSIVDNTIIGASAGNSQLRFTAPQTQLPEPEIRSVTHLYGAIRNGADVNGYPEAWHAPNGRNGFNISAAMPIPRTPLPLTVPYNPNPFVYGNNQEASMLWYHDNTMGTARHNVYTGLAGLYVIRDDNETNMIASNKLPASQHELPLVLQDRMFHTNGSFAYPVLSSDCIGCPPVSWVPEAYGSVMLVNGVSWPYLQVEPRLYRFRVLNASNSRFYTLSLMDTTNTAAINSFKVIGTDGGFLNAPVSTNSLTIAPGERYDIVVDFSAFRGKNLILKNSAGDLFGDALAKPEVPPTEGLVDQIMQFRVNLRNTNAPLVTLPASLRPTQIPTLTASTGTTLRKMILWETLNDFSRNIPIMGTTDQGIKLWTAGVTESPTTGTVETWEIYNNSFYPDPIHIDGATMQVVDRQEFTATLNINDTADTDGALSQFAFTSTPEAPSASEMGWKDTVIAPPNRLRVTGIPNGQTVKGKVTRVRVRFDSPAGQYAWYSQRLEHREHEMIRPLTIMPTTP